MLDPIILIISILILAISILGMFNTFLYIKYSWIQRNNSLNMTGSEFAEQEVLNKNLNSNIKVQPSILRWRFAHFNHNTNTMKTGYFVSKRKSTWSLADAATQAYASDIMKKERNGEKTDVPAWVYKIRAPLPQMMLSIVISMTMGLMSYGVYTYLNSGGSTIAWFFMIAGIIAFMGITIVYSCAVWKGQDAISKNSDKILGSSLTDKERQDIKFLWKITALIALITLIIEVFIRIAYLIMILSKSKGNNGN